MVELEKRAPRPGENAEEFLHREIGSRFRSGCSHGIVVCLNPKGKSTKDLPQRRGDAEGGK